jgi:hypothetical protein
MAWFRPARAWRSMSLDDVREEYPSADQVSRVPIFNVRNNRRQLIVRAEYSVQKSTRLAAVQFAANFRIAQRRLRCAQRQAGAEQGPSPQTGRVLPCIDGLISVKTGAWNKLQRAD